MSQRKRGRPCNVERNLNASLDSEKSTASRSPSPGRRRSPHRQKPKTIDFDEDLDSKKDSVKTGKYGKKFKKDSNETPEFKEQNEAKEKRKDLIRSLLKRNTAEESPVLVNKPSHLAMKSEKSQKNANTTKNGESTEKKEAKRPKTPEEIEEKLNTSKDYMSSADMSADSDIVVLETPKNLQNQQNLPPSESAKKNPFDGKSMEILENLIDANPIPATPPRTKPSVSFTEFGTPQSILKKPETPRSAKDNRVRFDQNFIEKKKKHKNPAAADCVAPHLLSCTESITSLCMQLAPRKLGIRLDNVLKRRSVWTVGDFAGLSAAAIPEINFIREPKLENVKRVLEKYQPSSPTKSHGSKSSDVKDSGDSETTTLKQKEDSQAADIYHSFDDSGSDNVMVKPSESESNEKDSEGMNVESEAKKTLDSESMKTPEKRPPAMDITPKRTITPLIRKTKSARDFTKLNDDDDTPTRNEGIDSNIAGNDNVNVNGERIGNESDDHNGNGHKNIDESMEVDETSGNEDTSTADSLIVSEMRDSSTPNPSTPHSSNKSSVTISSDTPRTPEVSRTSLKNRFDTPRPSRADLAVITADDDFYDDSVLEGIKIPEAKEKDTEVAKEFKEIKQMVDEVKNGNVKMNERMEALQKLFVESVASKESVGVIGSKLEEIQSKNLDLEKFLKKLSKSSEPDLNKYNAVDLVNHLHKTFIATRPTPDPADLRLLSIHLAKFLADVNTALV